MSAVLLVADIMFWVMLVLAIYAAAVALPRERAAGTREVLATTPLDGPAVADEALKHLQIATRQEKNDSYLWRLTATAWGRKNNDPMVAYALAEEAMARGDRSMAPP